MKINKVAIMFNSYMDGNSYIDYFKVTKRDEVGNSVVRLLRDPYRMRIGIRCSAGRDLYPEEIIHISSCLMRYV